MPPSLNKLSVPPPYVHTLTEKVNNILSVFLIQVFLFIPDKISEHNYRAIGSKNPEKTAREETNWLRNKCKKAIQKSDLRNASYSFIRWEEEVESCPQYNEALADIRGLYEANDEFRYDIRESTGTALKSLQRGREKAGCAEENKAERKLIDVEEGVLYLLKELALFMSVPSIYENCKEFVFVYHRPWPVLERFCGGYYDGIEKPSVGFIVSEQ